MAGVVDFSAARFSSHARNWSTHAARMRRRRIGDGSGSNDSMPANGTPRIERSGSLAASGRCIG